MLNRASALRKDIGRLSHLLREATSTRFLVLSRDLKFPVLLPQPGSRWRVLFRGTAVGFCLNVVFHIRARTPQLKWTTRGELSRDVDLARAVFLGFEQALPGNAQGDEGRPLVAVARWDNARELVRSLLAEKVQLWLISRARAGTRRRYAMDGRAHVAGFRFSSHETEATAGIR